MIKTILLPMEKAAIIQEKHDQFNCELREMGIVSNMSAKVTIAGQDNDVKHLFESIGE